MGERKPMPSISEERARELLAGPKPSPMRELDAEPVDLSDAGGRVEP